MQRNNLIFLSVLCFLIGLNFNIKAQNTIKASVKGTVTDAETGEPIPYVNVFLSNTTLGAATDMKGNFSIENIPMGNYVLIVSHVGYAVNTSGLEVLKSQTFIRNVKLNPKVIVEKEVSVSAAEPAKWKEQLQKFTEQFLGTDDNSEYCRIINPEVLNFKQDSKTGDLTASTDSMIYVENNALGYKLEILLEEFDFNPEQGRVRYLIFPKFTEIKPRSNDDEERWLENRKSSYLGSIEDFFSAVVHKNAYEKGFKIAEGELQDLISGFGKYIYSEDIMMVPQTFSPLIKIYFDRDIRVEYKSLPQPKISILHFNYGYVETDSLGNVYNRFPYETYGAWTSRRISQLLPTNYRPDER